jgi:hypothetical protein
MKRNSIVRSGLWVSGRLQVTARSCMVRMTRNPTPVGHVRAGAHPCYIIEPLHHAQLLPDATWVFRICERWAIRVT